MRTINGHPYVYDGRMWISGWRCHDNDYAQVYIDESNKFANIFCFSGVESSSIVIDVADFISLWHKAGYKESIHNFTFDNQCLYIADWLCSKFCEYVEGVG